MSWEINNKDRVVSDSCPEIKNSGKTVVLSHVVLGKIITLLNKYPNLEWGAYLVGEEKGDECIVEDIILMKQEVTGTTVEFVEEDFPEKCIGWLHSHNTMNVFLSGTDEATAMQYKITLVVNNKLEFECKIKQELPCGRIALCSADVKVAGVEVDTSKIIEKHEYKYEMGRILRDIPLTELPDEICPVCGYKLSKRKSKLAWCNRCQRYVHKRCFDEELGLCNRCVEEISSESDIETEKELIKERWKEYIGAGYDYYY